MTAKESIDEGTSLLEELRRYYLEKREPTVRLFWDSPLSADDVTSLEEHPRLSWLLAWKGEIFEKGEGDAVIPKPMLLAVTWGQDERLVIRLVKTLERQGKKLKRLLSGERKSDPDFFKWVKSSGITSRLLR